MSLVIGVDVDDVVADLMPAWLDAYNGQYDDVLRKEDITDWDMTKFVRGICGEKIYDFLVPGLYDTVPPILGALVGTVQLRAAGHRVVFVTSANQLHPGRKRQWLMEYGFFPDKSHSSIDYVEAYDKSLIKLDMLVDDGPHNIEAVTCQTIIFDQPWNRHLKGRRAHHWGEVTDFVLFEAARRKQPDAAPVEGWTTSISQGAVKYDGAKPRLGLVPPYPLLVLAQLFTKGTQKYADRNWEAGMPWERVYNAAGRHLLKFWLGEDDDPETGLPHMSSVAWCAFVLMEYARTHPELDDRPGYTAAQRASMLAEVEAK